MTLPGYDEWLEKGGANYGEDRPDEPVEKEDNFDDEGKY